MRTTRKARSARGLLATLLTAGLILTGTAAVAVPTGGGVDAPANDVDSELVMTGTAAGQGVQGAIAPIDTDFNPLNGYPEEIPADFSEMNQPFAGIITAAGTASGAQTLLMYCIDIRTSTAPGYGYVQGSWDDASVPHTGHVARVLAESYPNTDLPEAGGDVNARAAAVQAAIWFFTDNYVLSPSDPIYPLTAQIVDKAIADGPLAEPAGPDLTISPASATGVVGQLVGPYTVTGESAEAITVSAPGVAMFADADGANAIAEGGTVHSGQQIWLRAEEGTTSAQLHVTGTATVPGGSAYVYSQNVEGVDAGQKLILSRNSTLTTAAQATAEFTQLGSVNVDKKIAGNGEGQQGDVMLEVKGVFNGQTVLDETITIPAGTTGTTRTTYGELPVGTVVTVTETATGANSSVTVDTTGLQPVEVTEDGATITVTNEYTRIGSVVIDKTIAGSAAGSQDDVTLHVVGVYEDETVLDETVSIPAGTTGTSRTVFDDLPVGTVVTATEIADGANDAVSVTVTEGEPVTVSQSETAGIHVTNTYSHNGVVVVDKMIAGDGAGLQSAIELRVTGLHEGQTVLDETISIPAGAKEVVSTTFDDLPVGTVVTVTEPTRGDSDAVSVQVTGIGTQTITSSAPVAFDVTNTYTRVGSVVVNKTIAGPGAGQQDDVLLRVTSDTGLDRTILIPAGTTEPVATVIGGLPLGTVVTVTEPIMGANAAVSVAVTGLGTQVVTAGDTAVFDITNTYTPVSTGTDDPGTPDVDLPVTGFDAASLPLPIGIAVGALVAGGVLLALRRRMS